MTEVANISSFISGDITQIDLDGRKYTPDIDVSQTQEMLQEKANIYAGMNDDLTHLSYPISKSIYPSDAVAEMSDLIGCINSHDFFDTEHVSFIISPLKHKKENLFSENLKSEIADDVIDRMCAAMKAAGVNKQTISTVRATTKISIENSLTNGDEVPAIPSVAPRKYRGVIQDGPPIEFIRSVYVKWVIAEVLDREVLDKLDHNLVLAVYSYKKRNPHAPTLKDILASKSAADSNRRKFYSQAQNLSIVH